MKIVLRNKETVAGLASIGLSIYLLAEIRSFAVTDETIRSIGPEFIPNILAVTLGLLGVSLFVLGLRQPEAPIVNPRYTGRAAMVPGTFLLGSLLYIFGVPVVGFCVWALLYLAAGQYVMGERSPGRMCLLAGLITAVIFLTFAVALNVPLPRGIMGM